MDVRPDWLKNARSVFLRNMERFSLVIGLPDAVAYSGLDYDGYNNCSIGNISTFFHCSWWDTLIFFLMYCLFNLFGIHYVSQESEKADLDCGV